VTAFALLVQPARAADPAPTEPGTYLIEIGTGKTIRLGQNAFVAWAPGSKQVAVADQLENSPSGRLRLISVPDGRERNVELTQRGTVNQLRWSPDGTRLAFTLLPFGREPGPSLSVVTVANANVRQLVKERAGPFDWNPDGKSIAAVMIGYPDQSIVTLDATNGQIQKTVIDGPDAMCQSNVAWSPDGKTLAYAGPGFREGCGDASNWGIWIWDASMGKSRRVFEGVSDAPYWLANGDLVAMVGDPDSADGSTMVVKITPGTTGDPTTIARDIPDMFPPPAHRMQVVGNSVLYPVSDCDVGEAWLWSPGMDTPSHPTPAGTYAYRPALSADGKQLAYVRLADSSDLVVQTLGTPERRVVATTKDYGLQVGAEGLAEAGIDWSPDGKWLAIEVTSEQYRDCVN